MDEVRADYLKEMGLFGEDADSIKRRRDALDRAHDLRKFEIELIWKRSTYFWGLQIAAFAGLGTMLNGVKSGSASATLVPDISRLLVMAMVAVFGACTAIGWHRIALASKVYMVNWEKHIDFLEIEFTGQLYKTVYFRKDDASFSVEPGRVGPRYSITGINEGTTLVAAMFWWFVLVVLGFDLAKMLPLSLAEYVGLASAVSLVGALILSGPFEKMRSKSKYPIALSIRTKNGIFGQREL